MTDTTATDTATATAKPKTVVHTITMLDGRVVEFVGKRKMIKTEVPAADGGVPSLRFDWFNGESRIFPIPQQLLMKFAVHGALQKYGDEVAGTEDLDDQILAIEELHDRLAKGEWSVKREASGIAGTSVLMQALMEFRGLDKERVKDFLKDKTPAEKLALRNNAKIRPIIERIEAAKAAKASKIDSDALLGGLEGDTAA